ncbi:MAG: hypothetical protein QGH20_05025 [Candidatus Latescibacteria bacterium]|nr:hypothetical protein [Candidatus Latescibacterota bacterium]
MIAPISEDTLEQANLEWFEELSYSILHGPSIGPGEPQAERDSYGQVVLDGRLRQAVERINSDLPPAGSDESVRQVLRTDSPSLILNNRAFHRL